MSTKTITEKADGNLPDWQPLRETAPSVLRAEQPTVARAIGTIGLLGFVLGAMAIGFELAGNPRLIGAGWAVVLGFFGVGGMLYHAARETDDAIRRLYGVLGAVLGIGLAIVCAAYPAEVGTPMQPLTQVGGKFLPWGIVGLVLGLMFMLPAVRGETDPGWRKLAIFVIGAVGIAAAGVGLVGGSISSKFLLPIGLFLSLAGLGYLWALIGFIGTETDFGHRTAMVMAGAGLVVLLGAVGHSILAQFGWFGVPIQVGYLTSVGILLMGMGLLYGIVGLSLVSERPVMVLMRRELASFFYSPLIYFLLFGFAMMAWIRHWIFVVQASAQPIPQPIFARYFLDFMPVIFFIFMIPMLTMRLISEEERSGTLEMLLTVPLEESTVVLSKFFAVLIVFLLAWVPFGLYLMALQLGAGQTLDYRPLLSFAIGMVCSGANMLAMGLFFSSLTRSQLAAFVLTALGMFVWTATAWSRLLSQLHESIQAVLSYVSYVDLWDSTLTGQLQLGPLVLHVGLAIVWLFATVKVLESRKWR